MTTDYDRLAKQAEALLAGETDALALSANFVALLHAEIPACVRIPLGQGVCGTAAATGETQCIADVHAFEGHIACDPASNSELVVPLVADGSVFAVLDIDSPHKARFGPADQAGTEKLCEIFVEMLAAAGRAGPGFI